MRKVFLIFCMVLFLTMSISFWLNAYLDKELVLIIPGVIGFIGTILCIILLCKKQLKYCVINEELVVKQAEKIVHRFKKADIYSSKFVYDAFDKSLHIIQFSAQNKKHNIIINSENRNDMLLFFENTTKTTSDNLIYYVVTFLSNLQ